MTNTFSRTSRGILTLCVVIVLALGQGPRWTEAAEIHRAAATGDLQRVEEILEQAPEAVDQRGWCFAEPFTVMGFLNHLELVLQGIAPPPAAGTPLQLAAAQGDLAMARLLIEKGADVNALASDGSSALFLGVEHREEAMIRFLLANGARHDIFTASALGEADLVESLVENDPRLLNARDYRGDTALHWAAKRGQKKVVDVLLARGVHADIKGHYGSSPLEYAAYWGHAAVAEVLLAGGADPKARDDAGSTPLHSAAVQGHLEIVGLLMQTGADMRLVDGHGNTALHRAAAGGHPAVIEFLVRLGLDVNARDARNGTPLHDAAREGQAEAVSILLQHGAQVNAIDCEWMTPLHEAAWRGYNDGVAMLLENHADVNARDLKGHTPLALALEEGHEDTVLLLRQHGATE